MSKLSLFDDLNGRGLVYQTTHPTLAEVLKKKRVVYAGFDPTADSLHIGNLMPLLTLRRFQKAGHTPIAVLGGATGMIGDPSGKSEERNLLDEKTLTKNLSGIKKDIRKILDTKGSNAAVVVDNLSWFKNMGAVEYLREVGKHFTVNHMTAKESVRSRLEDREHGISYTEFSYMLLQAYDFFHLLKKKNCEVQIGGSDQWGNITAGCELIRRKESREVYGLTFPLITKSDGSKFGKTEKGAVWMSEDRTSPYELYQYFLRTPDADVIQLLKFLTFVPLEKISELEKSAQASPEKREAQDRLASELTEMLHGKAALKTARAASRALFGSEIRELDEKTLLAIFSEAPKTKKKKSQLKQGLPLVELLVETQLCPSKGAARRDVSGGGIYLNNERVASPEQKLSSKDLIAGKYAALRKGKKNYHLVNFS